MSRDTKGGCHVAYVHGNEQQEQRVLDFVTPRLKHPTLFGDFSFSFLSYFFFFFFFSSFLFFFFSLLFLLFSCARRLFCSVKYRDSDKLVRLLEGGRKPTFFPCSEVVIAASTITSHGASKQLLLPLANTFEALIDRATSTYPCLLASAPAEQERIARAVVDTDDTSWLLLQEVDKNGDEDNVTDDGSTTDGRPSWENEPWEAANLATGTPPSSYLPGDQTQSQFQPTPPISSDLLPDRCRHTQQLRLVGGVDISFVKGSEENACATLVVLEYPSLETVYEAHERVTMPLPYISGFLAFREVGSSFDFWLGVRGRGGGRGTVNSLHTIYSGRYARCHRPDVTLN